MNDFEKFREMLKLAGIDYEEIFKDGYTLIKLTNEDEDFEPYFVFNASNGHLRDWYY